MPKNRKKSYSERQAELARAKKEAAKEAARKEQETQTAGDKPEPVSDH